MGRSHPSRTMRQSAWTSAICRTNSTRVFEVWPCNIRRHVSRDRAQRRFFIFLADAEIRVPAAGRRLGHLKGTTPVGEVQITAPPPVSRRPANLVGTVENRTDDRLGATRLDPAKNVGRSQHPDATPVLIHHRRGAGPGPVEQANSLAHQHLPRYDNQIAVHHVYCGQRVNRCPCWVHSALPVVLQRIVSGRRSVARRLNHSRAEILP